MAGDYPYDDAEGQRDELSATTVRLDPETQADVELIARLWQGLDEVRGVERRKKWLPSRVMVRLVKVGVARFWEQVGGRPGTQAERDAYVRRAVSALRTRVSNSGH